MTSVRREPTRVPKSPAASTARAAGQQDAAGQAFWIELTAWASEVVAHSTLQPADRDDVLQESLLALLAALKCGRVECLEAYARRVLGRQQDKVKGRIRGRAAPQIEDEYALPAPDLSGDIEPESLLAEMPEPLRAWYRQDLGIDPPDDIARSTVRWRRTRILRWIHHHFFS